MLASFLNEYRSLPVSNPSNKVVSWHVFRTVSEAEEYTTASGWETVSTSSAAWIPIVSASYGG